VILLRNASLAAAFAVLALTAVADDPINQGCPVMRGKPVKGNFTSRYDGKTIAFCCGKCKKQWDADPKRWAAGIPELQGDQIAPVEIGKPAPPFKLKDTDGTEVALAALKDKIVVMIWLTPKDPESERVVTSGLLSKLAMDLKLVKDELVVLPVSSTERMEAKTFAKFLADNKVELKGLMDPDGKVGKSLGVKTNTTCVVIDGQGTLRMAGGLDDDPEGKKGEQAQNYVFNAVKQIVDGVKVELDTPTAYGTDVKYKK
jgi:peroxiredoxin/YHS domain-containing protein